MNPPISQFTVYPKTQCSTCSPFQTPSHESGDPSQCQDNISACSQCEANLKKLTALRKHNIRIEYENAQLTQQVHRLQLDRQHLITSQQNTVAQQIKNGDRDKDCNWKQDLQAEVFECKFLNQLLMLNKMHIQQDSQLQLKNKYEKLVMDHFVLQEQLAMKDRIIRQQEFYPLNHYDARISNLRKAVMHWYGLATKQCKQLSQALLEIRTDQHDARLEIAHKIKNIENIATMQFHQPKSQYRQEKGMKTLVLQETSIENYSNILLKSKQANMEQGGNCGKAYKRNKGSISKKHGLNSSQARGGNLGKSGGKAKNGREQGKNKDKSVLIKSHNCHKANCNSNFIQIR